MTMIRKNWRLRWLMILGVFLCFFITNGTVKASELENNEDKADILNELQLFEGTDQGYELENEASRNQSAVMLVRYLGLEDFVTEAYNQGELEDPFMDVPSWAAPHVAYLYQKGLTKGISSTQYGGDDLVTGNQYATMLLRMLGYNDLANEFHWSEAMAFLMKEYAINDESIGQVKNFENIGITRGQMVRLSYLSLYLDYKSYGYNVIDSLYYNEVISENDYDKYTIKEYKEYNDSDEIKAVWISYLDLKLMLKDTSAFGFRKEIQKVMSNVSGVGMNTIFVQVRPFSDALYESKVYEWSSVLTGIDGVGLGYDPFKIIIEEAKLKNLRVEAWINPYRIRNDIIKEPLNPDGVIAKMIEDKPSLTIQIGNRLMFNPGCDEVQEFIVSGVAEIVSNYDVDGIHFDDYFYPSEDLSFDALQFDQYVKDGGDLSHGEFRRERIDLLIKEVYTTIKSIDKEVVFGVSPQGSTTNNFEHSFIDVQKWIDNPGYIDYICPQIYYGFENETLDFSKVLKQWNQMVEGSHVDLYIGLAVYKIGNTDAWAGSGKEEWVTKDFRLKFMIELSRSVNNYKGIALFRYDSLFNPLQNVKEQVANEIKAVKDLLVK